MRRTTRGAGARWMLLCLVALSSCGSEERCAKVTCSPGRVCVSETGVCQAADAGR